MAAGKASDFKIYNEQLQGGLIETLVQETDVFNAASRGTIVLSAAEKAGHYAYEAFTKAISSAGISRRDITSVSSADDTALTAGELITVKLNRKFGPVAQTLDAFRKAGKAANEQSLSFLIGSQIAKGILVDMVDMGLLAARAAIAAQTTTNLVDKSATGTLKTEYLFDALKLMGDKQNDVLVWVMHSKAYFDLVKEQALTTKIEGIANYNIETGQPVTLNRPVIITDSSALFVDDTTDTYYTLGLTAGALQITESEGRQFESQIITGLENLIVRLQGEYAYNLGVKGFQWDVSNGAANPTSSTLGTGSNWDKVATSAKDLAGVAIYTQ